MGNIERCSTNKFEKELKKIRKRGKNIKKLLNVVNSILNNANKGIPHNELLPKKYRLHKLSGQFQNLWECHIESDWLLIFYLDDKMLKLERTGTHSDIFSKIKR